MDVHISEASSFCMRRRDGVGSKSGSPVTQSKRGMGDCESWWQWEWREVEGSEEHLGG